MKIDKKIKRPEKFRQGIRQRYPFAKMKVGDSFSVRRKDGKNLVSSLSIQAKDWCIVRGLNRKFTCRRISKNEVRIWRIK